MTLYFSGVRPKVMIVARLMLMAFVGAAPFDGAQACHFDDDPTHDSLGNLRWYTAAGNAADRARLGTLNGSKNGRAKLSEADVSRIRKMEGSQDSIAKVFGVDQTTISDVKTGRRGRWRTVARSKTHG